jgi:hypothetical protein
VLQCQHRLDQTGDAGGRVEVADVGFYRADRAEVLSGDAWPKSLLERRDLDRIAERRAGSVRLHVVDRFGVDAGHSQRLGDDGHLPIDARRGISDLQRAVVVDSRSFDHRMNVIAVCDCIFQSLQDDDADAVSEHCSLRLRIERATVTVGRSDVAFLVHVARVLRRTE